MKERTLCTAQTDSTHNSVAWRGMHSPSGSGPRHGQPVSVHGASANLGHFGSWGPAARVLGSWPGLVLLVLLSLLSRLRSLGKGSAPLFPPFLSSPPSPPSLSPPVLPSSLFYLSLSSPRHAISSLSRVFLTSSLLSIRRAGLTAYLGV